MVASIDYIEGVIATYQKATKANLDTPSREGNVVVLSTEVGDDVMITADLHGNRKNFNAIKRIADLEHHPRRHLILQEVCHGGPTYPTNNGDMSHGMLEDVAKLKVAYKDRVHFLLSNHELAELTDYPILKAKKMLNLMFRLGLQEMYGPATEKVREAYSEFLRSCPLAVVDRHVDGRAPRPGRLCRRGECALAGRRRHRRAPSASRTNRARPGTSRQTHRP